jgi:lysozyme family protein
MASIVLSIDYVLRQEDSRMSGEITNDPRDKGGRTRYGIAERFHPDLTSTGFFTTMSALTALGMAHLVYTKEYGDPLKIGLIDIQQVANALLSFAVNEGVKTSVELLQRALGLSVDGEIGPNTIRRINGGSVLPELYREQYAHYVAIVAANPSQERFFNGWINRCKQDCEVV